MRWKETREANIREIEGGGKRDSWDVRECFVIMLMRERTKNDEKK